MKVYRIRNKETGGFEKDLNGKSIFEDYGDVVEVAEQDEYEIVEYILVEKKKFCPYREEDYCWAFGEYIKGGVL